MFLPACAASTQNCSSKSMLKNLQENQEAFIWRNLFLRGKRPMTFKNDNFQYKFKENIFIQNTESALLR